MTDWRDQLFQLLKQVPEDPMWDDKAVKDVEAFIEGLIEDARSEGRNDAMDSLDNPPKLDYSKLKQEDQSNWF